MYRIVTKRPLHETVTLMEVEAPYIAKKAKPGQFIILRVDENGERVPLTVAGTDPARGTVTIIYQKVGYTTKRLDVSTKATAFSILSARWASRATSTA